MAHSTRSCRSTSSFASRAASSSSMGYPTARRFVAGTPSWTTRSHNTTVSSSAWPAARSIYTPTGFSNATGYSHTPGYASSFGYQGFSNGGAWYSHTPGYASSFGYQGFSNGGTWYSHTPGYASSFGYLTTQLVDHRQGFSHTTGYLHMPGYDKTLVSHRQGSSEGTEYLHTSGSSGSFDCPTALTHNPSLGTDRTNKIAVDGAGKFSKPSQEFRVSYRSDRTVPRFLELTVTKLRNIGSTVCNTIRLAFEKISLLWSTGAANRDSSGPANWNLITDGTVAVDDGENSEPYEISEEEGYSSEEN